MDLFQAMLKNGESFFSAKVEDGQAIAAAFRGVRAAASRDITVSQASKPITADIVPYEATPAFAPVPNAPASKASLSPSDQLRAVLPKLSEKDQAFALSLLRSRSPSLKQAHWIRELVKRATTPEPTRESVAIGDFSEVVAFLTKAASTLKRPAVLVAAEGRTLRLNIAGAKASQPGSINVCSVDRSYESRDWYGRVTTGGKFEPSRKFDGETQTAVANALRALASDPAKACADYGKLTGVCCFCNIPLTDSRSTVVGYGPVCAKTWGLPWDKK